MISIFAGPCVIESYEHMEYMAYNLKEICDKNNVNFIFKSSFDKANRTSIDSYRGVGIEKGLDFFRKLKNKNKNIKILTDIHEPWHAEFIDMNNKKNKIIDFIQIPALLSRQTDLIIAASKTNCGIVIKKGQFMSPYTDIEPILEKIKSIRKNLNHIYICERGTIFGYNYLINDFKGLYHMMKNIECEVIFDATHSVQIPGGVIGNKISGGKREFIEPLALAAVAIGIKNIFMEVHDEPDNALSDSASMLHLSKFEQLVKRIKNVHNVL